MLSTTSLRQSPTHCAQSGRDVAGRLAPTKRGKSRRRFSFGKIRRAWHAARGRRINNHHVVGCRCPRVGGFGRILSDEGTRKGGRDGMRGGRRRDLRVNTVHPGVIDTPIWTKIPASTGGNEPIDPKNIAKAGVPLRRAGQAQDIGNGVLFLASDASSYNDRRGARD
jgi:hypothetical protein